MGKFKFPTAYTILFVLTTLVATVTWIVPAGKYQMVTNAALGKEVPAAGTYVPVETQPQGITTVLLAPTNGLYSHQTYTAGAIDVALLILVIGGLLGVINKTGVIDAGIERVTAHFSGREEWMIPILMVLFVVGDTIYRVVEESLPSYMLLAPIMMAARFDPLIVVVAVLSGSGIGALDSTTNLSATIIAANTAGIPFTQSILLRVTLLLAGHAICVYWVMRCARKVRNSPESSIVADRIIESQARFLGNRSETMPEFTPIHKTILMLFAASFAFMIYDVAVLDWWAVEISVISLTAVAIVGVVARMDEGTFTSTSIDGVRDLLDVTLIIGITRGIVVVMDNGVIMYIVLHSAKNLVSGLPTTAFINVTYWLEVLLSSLVPSPPDSTVLTMPTMAPLADFAHVQRDLVVTAYQPASGVANLITPTSVVAMGGLTIARVPWVRYLR